MSWNSECLLRSKLPAKSTDYCGLPTRRIGGPKNIPATPKAGLVRQGLIPPTLSAQAPPSSVPSALIGYSRPHDKSRVEKVLVMVDMGSQEAPRSSNPETRTDAVGF